MASNVTIDIIEVISLD